MKTFIRILTILLMLILLQEVKGKQLPLLKISQNHRFLMTATGDPFFWLGDTGWLLFARLSREEAEKYLNDRAEKGFNVIQVMVLHSEDIVNAYGDTALNGGDVSRPRVTEGDSFGDPEAYDYWDHVDYIIRLAEEKGLYMALVPVWGSVVRSGKVNRDQAAAYATWLSQRYANRSNIIWLNGGDTRGDQNTEIWEAIGCEIRRHAPRHLISFHPFGRTRSSMWFHDAGWLDLNMFQSGHRRYDQDDSEFGYGQDNWKYVRDDYCLEPAKPTLDGEPSYEGIPQGLHDPSQPYWTPQDVRRYAYWSVFSGACGFTYGHNAVMQMHKPGNPEPAYGVREYWTAALEAEGAGQMIFLKNLMLSKSYFDRVPAQDLLAEDPGEKYDYLAATRGEDYAFIYTWNGREIRVKMGILRGSAIRASWFNPRNGQTTAIGVFENLGIQGFNPPIPAKEGMDWVLVLESHGSYDEN